MSTTERDTTDPTKPIGMQERIEQVQKRVRAVAPPEARAFIRERGGRLYVWATRVNCCGSAVTTVHTSTEAPSRVSGFRELDAGEFLVLMHPSIGDPPDEVELSLRGLWRKRITVFWERFPI